MKNKEAKWCLAAHPPHSMKWGGDPYHCKLRISKERIVWKHCKADAHDAKLLGHIISDVTWGLVVFSASDTLSPSWGWSSLSLWPCSTLPRIRSLKPEPSGGFLCSLCVVIDGPPPHLACDAESSVSPTEGRPCKASAPYLRRQAPCQSAVVAIAE